MAVVDIKISDLRKGDTINQSDTALGLQDGEAKQLPIGSVINTLRSNINTLRGTKADVDDIATLQEALKSKASKNELDALYRLLDEINQNIQDLQKRVK